MTNYIETKIDEINDEIFHTMIAELCQCVNFDKAEFRNKTLANFFSAVVMQERQFNLNLLVMPLILDKRLTNLDPNSIVYGVCCELTNRSRKALDDMMKKSVFAIIKQCYRNINPPMLKALTRIQKARRFNTELILRRRDNGSYY